jgi:hypothetical protein
VYRGSVSLLWNTAGNLGNSEESSKIEGKRELDLARDIIIEKY